MTEMLYNGICLPKDWPPKNLSETSRELLSVPYLKNPPSVIPINVGRQLFVDDFLIEHTTLHRSFHTPRLYEQNPILKPETSLEMNNGICPSVHLFQIEARCQMSSDLTLTLPLRLNSS